MIAPNVEADLVIDAKPLQRILVIESPHGMQLVGVPAPWWSLVFADVVLTGAIFAIAAAALLFIPFRSGRVAPPQALAVAGFVAAFVLMVVGLGQLAMRSEVTLRQVLLTIRRERGAVIASASDREISWPAAETRVEHVRAPGREIRSWSIVRIGGRHAAVLIPHHHGRAWVRALHAYAARSANASTFRPAGGTFPPPAEEDPCRPSRS